MSDNETQCCLAHAEVLDPAASWLDAIYPLIAPLAGALLKNERDVHLFERIAFMARRRGE